MRSVLMTQGIKSTICVVENPRDVAAMEKNQRV